MRVPKRLGLLLRWVFGLAGIVFLVVAFTETWRRSQGFPIPRGWALLSAELLILAVLLCSARAWVQLLPERGFNRSLAAGFYASQLGRYIPGVIWQPLAQVGLATRSGVPLPQASTAFGVHALVQLAAGGTAGATLALFGSGVPVAIRLSAPAALLPLLLLRRRWLVRALQILGRVVRRNFAEALVPAQPAILTSYGWTLCAMAASSVAFALLLSSLEGGAPILASAGSFALAWMIGFLAVPFPSGIGVREAVLLVTIGFAVPRSHVIAAAIGYRLVLMVGEVFVLVWSRIALKLGAPPAGAHEEPRSSNH